MASSSFPASETIQPTARLSSPWESDSSYSHCHECKLEFNPRNRRHHCRLCGKIFCHDCSSNRSLIPPSSIVLIPKGGKKFNPQSHMYSTEGFIPEMDPNRMLTYTSTNNTHGINPYRSNNGGADTLIYGKGLEERYKLAREPLRVCNVCHDKLKPVQDELRASNSNAVRYNSIDPTDAKRFFNSPLAFTLGHEIRKAAYTLNNLLPLPKRPNLLYTPIKETYTLYNSGQSSPITNCKNICKTVSPNLGDLDGVRIPARLLEQAKGIAVLTVFKGGFVVGGEFGSGLVVVKLDDDRGDGNGIRWSAPSSIGTVGMSWGALAGAQISDHVFLLMNDEAVELMATSEGSIQLGADIGVAVGPIGRALEANVGATASSGEGKPAVAPIYTYSLSKGLYAGVSLDGKVIVTRHRVNEKFYGYKIRPSDLLSGKVASPPAAQPLYDALKRCHVYATNSAAVGGVASDIGEMCRGNFINSNDKGFDTKSRDHQGFYFRDEEGHIINYEDWGDSSDNFVPATLPPPRVGLQTSEYSPMSSDNSFSTSESSF